MDQQKFLSETKKVFISTKIKKVNAWTKEEDEILLAQAEKYGYRHWKKIAYSLKNRSSIQCSARYKRIRPGLVKGNWGKEEDQLVLDLVTKFGKNWSLISKYIPSRTGKQIRDRYLNTLDSNINRERFSPDEDKKILELYLQYGTKWSHIAKFFEKRTGDMIKNRFYSTLRKKVHGFVRIKKNSTRFIKRLRKIKKNLKSNQKNVFQIKNLQIINNEILVKENPPNSSNFEVIKMDNQQCEKIDDILSTKEEDISKLKTDSSIYPNNPVTLTKEKSSFSRFNKTTSYDDYPLSFPQFPPYNQPEKTSNITIPQQSLNYPDLSSLVRQINVNEYAYKIKQIENSMNQSLLNYLNFSSQYQMMNTLYNFYLNN
jgi:hypothetical protein